MLTVAAMLVSVLALAGAVYNAAAAVLAGRYRRVDPVASADPDLPAVTVLKPLHGAEPALAANLATAFAQVYPAPVHIVCGARALDDPALEVAAGVATRYPAVAVDIVSDATRHGVNNKLSNLVNMAARIRHPLVVIADSDVALPPDALVRLAAALAEPGVGLATCLHAGRGDAGFWSRVAAMDISYRFMPSVIVGTALGLAPPALGPAMALRHETLAAIGGFAAFNDVLADDHEIGSAVRALGLRTVLPAFFVTHGCSEATFGALVRHELRWSLTIFRIEPAGFTGSFITHSFALAVIGALLAGLTPVSLGVVAAALAVRLAVKRRMDAISGIVSGPLWLLPLRDLLSFGVFCATFVTNDVDWRGSKFAVTRNGRLLDKVPG